MLDMLGMMPPEMILEFLKSQMTPEMLDDVIVAAGDAYAARLAQTAANDPDEFFRLAGVRLCYLTPGGAPASSDVIPMPEFLMGALTAVAATFNVISDLNPNMPDGVNLTASRLIAGIR